MPTPKQLRQPLQGETQAGAIIRGADSTRSMTVNVANKFCVQGLLPAQLQYARERRNPNYELGYN